jgi:putative transposase
MVDCRQNQHSVWDIKYHMTWVTKYRYKVLRGEIAVLTRDLLRQICQGREVVIVQGSVSPDHVHML